MSSARYCSTIQPDRRLRRVVIGVALLLLASGVICIVALPLNALWRLLLSTAWLVVTGIEMALLLAAYRKSTGYRLYADGSIDVMTSGGRQRRASVAAGGVVLPGIAWLRIRLPGGRCWGELIADNPRKNKDWRRLQVICRLLGPC